MEKFESNFKDLKDGLDQNEFQGKESVINCNEPFLSIIFKVLFFQKCVQFLYAQFTKILNILRVPSKDKGSKKQNYKRSITADSLFSGRSI